jgi:hypothetical protein
MIPKILHFCFGFSPAGGDWGLAHYVCVKSALERIQPEQAYLYFEYLPSGPFWYLTSRIIDCRKVIAPRAVFGKPLIHYAHRADVFRLERLISVGGIYLDCDVFVHRDFEPLLANTVVLAKQTDTTLCNAVILAEADAPFLHRWFDEYRSFRSTGHDQYWDEHSIVVPGTLARAHPSELTILGSEAFFQPSWEDDDLKRIFVSSEPLPTTGVYANHLWESCAWFRYLRNLTPARVRARDSNFHFWVRPLVADLPDDLGSRSKIAQLTHDTIAFFGSDSIRRDFRLIAKKIRHKVRRFAPFLRHRYRMVDGGVAAAAAVVKRLAKGGSKIWFPDR